MNRYELAALLATAGLDDNTYRKIPATTQQALFGRVVFGRKSFCADPTNQGRVWVSWWTDATNNTSVSFSYEEFAALVNSRRVIRR